MKGLGIGFGVVAVMSVFSSPVFANGRVINGTIVSKDTAPEVVRIKSGDGHCTATIVGPDVIATAAHCGDDGGKVTFSLYGSTYTATLTHSSLYASQGHDVAFGVLDRSITSITPSSIGSDIDVGYEIEMYGYGCTKKGGGGGNDGELRLGRGPVTSFRDGEFISKGSDTSSPALCFGDSGGPAYRGYNVVGIASKGNISDTSYWTDLTTDESVEYMQAFAKAENVDICGITTSCSRSGNSRVINGQPVKHGDYLEVVKLVSGNSTCMATIVGERVIATTAHCVEHKGTVTFMAGGKSYTAKMERSSLYPKQDHDLALGLVNAAITGVKPATIGGKAEKDLSVDIVGMGCTTPGGSGGNDGILRVGTSVVTGTANLDFVTRRKDGAALCFGDSGGPAYGNVAGGYLMVGLGSKGNITDTSYFTDLSLAESVDFLNAFSANHKVEICGINGKVCN